MDNGSESLSKRLKLASNAFKSSELPLQHKEAFLLHWLINKIDNGTVQIWKLSNEWLKSNQFHELSRNDINSEEITNIVEVFENLFSFRVFRYNFNL